MGLAHSPRIVTDNLVLALDSVNQKSWGSSGATWQDMSGKSNNGTLTNGLLHSQGPFLGAGSVFFDGQGNHSQLDVIYTSSLSADFDLSGNISSTLECWVYLTAYPGTTQTSDNPHWGSATIFSIKNSASNIAKYYFYSITTSGQLEMTADYGGGFPATGTSTSTLSLNTWYHIAWVRDSGSNKFFLDGTEITSEFSTPNASNMIGSGNSKISIGADFYQSSTLNWLRPITGYISNFRVVKGTALYTSNFTVPKEPLQNISNTKLLTCQGSSITDASSSSQTLSSNGGPTATYNDDAYFDFDGTNDYVQVSASSDLNFGTGNFTIEGWFNKGATTANLALVSSNRYYINGNNGNWILRITSATQIAFVTYDGTSNFEYTEFSASTSLNTWHHFALVREGTGTNETKFYLDGVLKGSMTVSKSLTDAGTNGLRIGEESDSGPGNVPFNGKISNIKIYKGKGFTAAEVAQNYNALKRRYA